MTQSKKPILCENLRYLRIKKGITQREVANKVFVSRNNYNRFESGERRVPLDVLMRICELFEVTPNELLIGETKAFSGGIVPPGFPNDTFLARLTSGDKIIPSDKKNEL